MLFDYTYNLILRTGQSTISLDNQLSTVHRMIGLQIPTHMSRIMKLAENEGYLIVGEDAVHLQ